MIKLPDPATDMAAYKDALGRFSSLAKDHLFVTYLGLFKRMDPQSAQDTTAVAGCLVAAAIDVAALVGQDLGVSLEQLHAIMEESYGRAIAGAPRWG
jgi:hypothetical protein